MGVVQQDASCRAANAEEPSLLWDDLQGECAKSAGGGDWDGVNVLNGAIPGVAKGKGKGKGGAKGASPNSWQRWRWGRRELLPRRSLRSSRRPNADTWMWKWLQRQGEGQGLVVCWFQ